MMPMVFSATALSMPAFAASCSTSSSILPRPRPVVPDPCLLFHLDLLLDEIQAMTSGECKIHIRSHGKCCNAARVAGKSRPLQSPVRHSTLVAAIRQG